MRRILTVTIGLLALLATLALSGCDVFEQLFGDAEARIRVEYVTGGDAWVAENGTVDFGEVEFDSSVDGTFRIANEGASSFEVEAISCDSYEGGDGFDLVSSVSGELGPNETKEFTVRFAPSSEAEGYGATICIGIRDSDEDFAFNVSGTGYAATLSEPAMEVYDVLGSPLESGVSEVYMGDYLTGDVPATVSLPVANTGNTTLNISSVGDDPAGSLTFVLNQYTLEPDEQTTLDVAATTETPGNPVTATLTLHSDDPAGDGEFTILFSWYVTAP